MPEQGFQLQLHDRVARLALHAPPRNILTADLQRRLAAAVNDLAARPVNLLVLESALDDFSVGADVREHVGREAVAAMLAASRALCAALLRFPAPTLSVLRGHCLGGGFELALACDQWLVGESARIGLPEITLGCYPPAALILAPQRLPWPLAAELVQTGRVMDGTEFAPRAGARLVPESAMEQVLGEEIGRYSGLPAGPLRQATRLLRPGAAERFEAAIGGVEAAYLEQLMALADATEGPKAFLEKRPPRWSHSIEE